MIGNRRNFSKPRKGFTLVEMIVAMALFLMGTLLVSVLFMNFLKDNDRLRAQQELSQNGRSILENMAKAIREKSLDATLTDDDTLAFLDGTVFQYTSPNILKNGSAMNPSSTTVSSVIFSQDSASEQPLMLILVRLEKTYRGKTESMDFQTTISSRVYE